MFSLFAHEVPLLCCISSALDSLAQRERAPILSRGPHAPGQIAHAPRE